VLVGSVCCLLCSLNLMHHLGSQTFFLTVEFSPCASSSLVERERHARPTGVLGPLPPSPLPLMPPPVHTSRMFSIGSTYARPNFTYTRYTSIQFWYKKVVSCFCLQNFAVDLVHKDFWLVASIPTHHPLTNLPCPESLSSPAITSSSYSS
jgi:hypothetical protein